MFRWIEDKLTIFTDKLFRKEDYVESVELWNNSGYTFLPYLYMPNDQVGICRRKTVCEVASGHVDYTKMFPTWC
jgi:hypothetical protein